MIDFCLAFFQWKGAVVLIPGMEVLEGRDQTGTYLGCGRVAAPLCTVATSHALNTR